jgi:putative hydrolase
LTLLFASSMYSSELLGTRTGCFAYGACPVIPNFNLTARRHSAIISACFREAVRTPVIDLHTHSLMSDGALIPAELVRRAEMAGCRYVAITDHMDASVLDFAVPRVATLCRELNRRWKIRAIPGVELTHNPPEDIARLAARSRELGAAVVVVHGETIVEPVPPGTNRAAIEAGVDILAHPGLLDPADCRRAAERGVFLELTTRRGHCYTNGYVAGLARTCGARLILNTDSHEPGDLVGREKAGRIARGAGLDDDEIAALFANAEELALQCLQRMTG